VIEQGGLTDAWLAVDDQRRARTLPGRLRQQFLDPAGFLGAPEQHTATLVQSGSQKLGDSRWREHSGT
jgi:hypothetical protein